jgi:2-polyprenyl-3-methyl-5-hydroxy-6-metoxy-1,4-benzoquinol methylase
MYMSDDMVRYYRDRAKEYEEIYEWRDPKRQEEQDLMEATLKDVFMGRRVLDIGCGTGYWTQRISQTAESILGIDINETVLEIAHSKEYRCPTEYRIMDAFNIILDEKYSGVLATFMLSHVLREDIPDWLTHVHTFLEPKAMVFFGDNTYIEGVGGKLQAKNGDLNTYKLRSLNDGSQHLIVKNYFTKEELIELFQVHSKGLSEKNLFLGKCFWWISYLYEP